MYDFLMTDIPHFRVPIPVAFLSSNVSQPAGAAAGDVALVELPLINWSDVSSDRFINGATVVEIDFVDSRTGWCTSSHHTSHTRSQTGVVSLALP